MFGFLTPRLLFIGALVAAGLAIFGYAMWTAKKSGELDATLDIIRKNQEAGNAGEAARLDRQSCVARGLRWDFVTGQCVGEP